MASTYIATFYAHIGAIRFQKLLKSIGGESKMMPVPRSLSSSCGTCVRYTFETPVPAGALMDEIEQIVLEEVDASGAIHYIKESVDSFK